MRHDRTGNNQFLKEFNESVLLDLIRLHKQISKADLAQITGLSPTATGMIVTKLLDKGYIFEAGIGQSNGGRRPVLYELKPRSYYSIGIDIDVDYIRFILMDITGQVEYREQVTSLPEHPVKETVQLIKQKIDDIIDRFKIEQDMLVGIGLSVPALVDNTTHEIILAPNLGWQNVNIVNELMLQEMIYVDNEAMCSAFSENWLGSCTEEKNFVCINMKSGIGSSIFANGNLYRGFCGSAGEIGHIMIDKNGPKCACGNYGCLETFVSARRMVQKAKTMVRQGLIADIEYSDVDAITYEDIINAAQAGSESAKQILAEAAGYLGLGIANIINTINPSKIVLGKELAKLDIVMDHLKGIVSANALSYPASRTDIEVSALGEDVSALGAAIIPFRKLFGYKI